MVARLIHRHAISDRVFPGSHPGCLDDIGVGDIVLFGADIDAARAIRDAAHGLGETSQPAIRRLDLGDMDDPESHLPDFLAIVAGRGARSVMLGGNAELGTALAKGFAGSSGALAPAVVLMSPQLHISPPRQPGTPALAIGTTRLVGRQEHDAWRSAGGAILPAATFDITKLEEALTIFGAKAREALLVVDLSVVDTGYAAGATLRNVGGLSPIVTLEAVARIRSRFEIRGLCLLNLMPERDPRGHSERIAAMIIQSVLAGHAARHAA
ncbi:MAG: arginase family protein [Methylobacterium sp.]|jgi:hypothetical protein|nr:arginase family protein [Methylobacterium sp.]MCA3602788.1 arginase family protein [Methylobacterium sp.]MCA3612327.1 arginase family protein [Methylobacterium sp.]MCA3615710.1 arginase family protein [Methylobacterium sp.]MCA3624846.1 arginase family protein [Methylobacterium sp.]